MHFQTRLDRLCRHPILLCTLAGALLVTTTASSQDAKKGDTK